MRAELRAAREESAAASRASREELARGLAAGNETLATQLTGMAEVQRTQLDGVSKRLGEMTESNRKALDGVRATMDTRLIELQAGNEKKLEQMRVTVDEKLQSTLEKRLGESFKLVSDQLESVQKGLGEMQSLATGVGDLKRVLTNVKARGTWAEVQLGALLEEILTPAQFERNVHVEPGSREMVEYAVKLPGPKDDPAACVWLPIDSKFPQEDYARVQDAADCGDAEACARRLRRPGARGAASRRSPSTTSTSSRRTPPTSASCSWPRRACTRRSSAGPRWSRTCSSATGWSWRAPRRSRRC